MAINSARPKVVDLFAGVGGLSLGFEQAGFDVAAAVEYDPVHMAAHEFNFPNAASFARDIRDISGAEILESEQIGGGEVHTVVGGAPCQGFSLIGKRALDDPRNQLVAEFARVVLEIEPRYFVLENVAGLASGKHKKFLDEVIELFERNNYQILTPVQVLEAAAFGVPQSRKRLFLIGAKAGLPLPTYPMPTTTPRKLNGSMVTGELPLTTSVFEAIGDLPDVDIYDDLLTSDSTVAELGAPSAYVKQLREFKNVEHFGHFRSYDTKILTSSLRTNHTEKSRRRFQETSPGTTEPVSRFLRLHPEGISNTLRAGTASDRGAHTSPRPIHPEFPRVITVREAARLHGFPDWFRFHTTKWHGFRQIGNSVPPLLGEAVGSSILLADRIKPTKGSYIESCPDISLLRLKPSEAESYFGIDHRVIPQRTRKV